MSLIKKSLVWAGEHVGATVLTTLTTLVLGTVGVIVSAHWPAVKSWLLASHAVAGSLITSALALALVLVTLAYWLGGRLERRRSSNEPAVLVVDEELNIEWRIVIPLKMWLETELTRFPQEYVQSIADGPYHGRRCKSALVIPPEADPEGPLWCVVCQKDVFSFTDTEEIDLKRMRVAVLEEVQRLHRIGRRIRRTVVLERPSYRYAVVKPPREGRDVSKELLLD